MRASLRFSSASIALLLAACRTGNVGNPLPGPDVVGYDNALPPNDARPIDVVSFDAGGDARADATPDVRPDVAADRPATDSPPGSEPTDAQLPDAAPDVAPDVALDVPVADVPALDVVPDVAPPDVAPPDAPPVDTGGTGCALGRVLLSEVCSRGAGGASDEFVELYNASASPVTLDSTWRIEARSSAAGSFSTRWTGTGTTIPAWGHYLIAGTSYARMPSSDAALTSGLTDAGSVRLVHGTTTVDTVCYAFDAATTATLTGDTTYGCEGMPASNTPHDNNSSSASNVDSSIERRPGGAGGNCADTNVNATDFVSQRPSTPQSLASPLTP